MNGSTSYTRSMWGLNDINADSITTNNLIVTGPIKTDLLQSTAPGQSLTLEAQGSAVVNLKSNGTNYLIVDDSGGSNKVTINNGLAINNNNLNFTRTTTSTQVIQWTDEFSNSLGLLFASTLSSAFQFNFNPTYMTNGFIIKSSGTDKLQITNSVSDFFSNPVRIRTGIQLVLYNETDTNYTNMSNFGQGTYFNNVSATGSHNFQINSGLVFSVNYNNIDAYKNIVVRDGKTFQVGNVGGTNFINFSAFGTSTYINNFDATGSHILQIGGVAKFTIAPSSVTSVSYITVPTEAAGSSNTRCATTAFVSTATATAISNLKNIGLNEWANINLFYGQLQKSVVAGTGVDICNLDDVNLAISTSTVSFASSYPQLVNDDFNELNTTVGFYKWVSNSNGGTGAIVATTSKAHMGIYEMTVAAAAVYRGIRGASIYADTPDEIIWVSRTTTANINWTMKVGIANPVLGTYTNSCVFDHDPTSNKFTANINNTLVNTFTMVSTQNKWYSFKITFNNPNILFTLTNVTDNVTETYNYTGGAWNFSFAALVNLWIVQNNVVTSSTWQLDYWSMKYTSSRV